MFSTVPPPLKMSTNILDGRVDIYLMTDDVACAVFSFNVAELTFYLLEFPYVSSRTMTSQCGQLTSEEIQKSVDNY